MDTKSKIDIDQKFGTKCISIAKQRTENTTFLNNVPSWNSIVGTKITEKELLLRVDIDTEKIKYLVHTLEDLEPATMNPHGLEHYEIFDSKIDAIKYYNEIEFKS